jgi:colanic acid biosynthesis glycosyl transferase WcaI
MKILLYGLNFAPEPTGIGKYTGELAAWLVAAGHEVRVIAAPPYYPSWSVGDGYSPWRNAQEKWQGVRVWRTPLWVPARPTGMKRILHLLSFAVLSLPALTRQLFWRPHVILVVAPALACAPCGWLAAQLCGAKSWLHIQDFEVDAAFRLGLLKGRLVHKIIGMAEQWLLRRFDRVSTISQRMMDLLALKKVQASRAVLLPNWVDVSLIQPMHKPSAYRAALNIPDDAVVALYSGSMTGKQGLELLPAAARALQERLPNLVFVLCGDGVFKPSLERDTAGAPNVRMLPLQPANRLGELLGMADVHLLPQHAHAADLVMPSKLTGMLSSGRPVLATAHPGTELATVVSGCGTVVPPDDLPAFVEALATLAESAHLRTRLGHAARLYAESHLARDRVLIDFEQGLKQCVFEATDASPPVETAASATATATASAAAAAAAAADDKNAKTT